MEIDAMTPTESDAYLRGFSSGVNTLIRQERRHDPSAPRTGRRRGPGERPSDAGRSHVSIRADR
jgi:hypothetical protein